jgi:hypothetical protein
MSTTKFVSLLGATALAVAGCRDGGLGGPVPNGPVNLPHGAVQAVVLEDTTAQDGSRTYIVRVVSRDVVVSSYQGVVTFPAGAFTLVSTGTPTGQSGETYVLNPAGFAQGRIRFAALTTTEFAGVGTGDGVEAFRFAVRPADPTAQPNVSATLDVVGTDVGRAVGADRVLASPAVKLLTAPSK